MRIKYLIILIMIGSLSCVPQTEFDSYDDYPIYDGSDLGINYSPKTTVAKIWAPTASEVTFRTYATGHEDDMIQEYPMKRKRNGVWELQLKGDQNGTYYTFQARVGQKYLEETPGPYAIAAGINGKRGMILDLEATNPQGWDNEKRPDLDGPEDIIIYELHVRDMTIHESAGAKYPGKFLGLAEGGLTNKEGDLVGLDHIAELGVTHVHLLPSFDYRSIDETKLDENKFNWGYDPQHYNVPEGSYATDPYDAAVRIREFKTLVQALHEKGIRVIMDVVYNHTGATVESVFNQTVPAYYYRHNEDGSWSDAAACGNETASERPMMRKYIIESVKYWAQEYHIDGFRFDLMGIHDIETMNLVKSELTQIDPTIFVYGEGWTAGGSPLPDSLRALKANTMDLEGVAAFSDDLRDGLKGSVFEEADRGFASGKPGMKESIKFGIVAATQHDQIDYKAVNYSNTPWSPSPTQTINYVSCHDNNTLYDKLLLSVPEATEEQLINMHKLSQTIVLTSQGVSFLHAGTDLLRTKYGVENSYQSPDSINQIDWGRKSQFREVFDYYRELVALRKQHPAFRMPSTELIQKHLRFIEIDENNLLAYQISDNANGDKWKNIFVAFNGNMEPKSIDIPNGNWKVILENHRINREGMRNLAGNTSVEMKGSSALILAEI